MRGVPHGQPRLREVVHDNGVARQSLARAPVEDFSPYSCRILLIGIGVVLSRVRRPVLEH